MGAVLCGDCSVGALDDDDAMKSILSYSYMIIIFSPLLSLILEGLYISHLSCYESDQLFRLLFLDFPVPQQCAFESTQLY